MLRELRSQTSNIGRELMVITRCGKRRQRIVPHRSHRGRSLVTRWKQLPMTFHRLSWRGVSMVAVCLFGAIASNASAAHIPGMSQLGGFTYIDRNNDGVIAFASDPNPEYAIGDVSISLYSVVANVETLVSTILSDPYGQLPFREHPARHVLAAANSADRVRRRQGYARRAPEFEWPADSADRFGRCDDEQRVHEYRSERADVGGEFYNFGEHGLAAGYASKRYLLGFVAATDSSGARAGDAAVCIGGIWRDAVYASPPQMLPRAEKLGGISWPK